MTSRTCSRARFKLRWLVSLWVVVMPVLQVAWVLRDGVNLRS